MDKYLLLLFTLMGLSGCHCHPDPRYGYLEWHEKDVEFLIAKLENGDIGDRERAAGAVGRIGEPAQAAVPVLIRVLEDEISWMQRNATVEPSPSNQKPEGLTRQEEEVFRREMVRCAATWALGHIGPPAIDAVPVLLLALKDPDKTVRSNAARSLGQIGEAGYSDSTGFNSSHERRVVAGPGQRSVCGVSNRSLKMGYSTSPIDGGSQS